MTSRRSSCSSSPEKSPTVDDGWVLGVALKQVPRILEQFGIDPGEVATRVGFDLRWLDNPDERIAFTLAGRFVSESARETRCAHFGLLLGTQEGFTALGIVGHLAQHARNVGEALKTLEDFLHHQEIGAAATLHEESGVALLEYNLHRPLPIGGDEIVDGGIGIGLAIMHALCGNDWRPTAVQLMRQAPEDVTAYRRILGAPPQFGADRNALQFDAHWLSRPVHGADPDLRRILEAAVAELDARTGLRFRDHVRTVLRTLLLSGSCSAELVAARLAMNRRRLHRRLASEGATYEALLDETRYDLATTMLRNSRAPLLDIAIMLNYRNASAFTRAFRRWSGEAPSQWRRSRQPSVAAPR